MTIVRYIFLLLVLTRAGLGVLLGMVRYGGEQSLSLGALLNALTFLIAIMALARRGRPSLKVPALIWLPYLAIACYSLTYTPDFFNGARLFLSTLTFPAMFVSAFILLGSDGDTIKFFKCAIYSSIAPTLYGIVQLASNGPGFRENSTFGHANIFAFYIVAMLVAISYYNVLAPQATDLFWRYFSMIYFVILCGLLVMTQTRSAWIEAAFIFAAYAISVNRKFLLALPVIIFALFLPPVADRLGDLNSGNEASIDEVERGEISLNSYVWRETLWWFALSNSANDRVFGKGIGAFAYNSRYFFPLLGNPEEEIDAHSGYVQAIYELGIPGVVAYVGLYIGVILAVWRSRQANRQLAYLIIAFIIGNLIINYSDNLPYYLDYNWYVWAIFGADLSWRLRRLRSSQENYGVQALADPALLSGRFAQRSFRTLNDDRKFSHGSKME